MAAFGSRGRWHAAHGFPEPERKLMLFAICGDIANNGFVAFHLLGEWRDTVAGLSSKLPTQLVDLLAESPFWTAKKVAERTGVAFTTAQRAIDRLCERGILAPTSGAKRDRVYCAAAIMAILDEPALLTPSRR